MKSDHHKYTLAEMADLLDCSKSYVSRKARAGESAKGFPVGEHVVTDGTGKISHFYVPPSAFEGEEESEEETGEAAQTMGDFLGDAEARENADVDQQEARENANVEVEVNATSAAADQSDEQEEEKEEQEPERQRQPMPNRNGRSAPSLLSSFAALGGAVTLLGLFGSSDKK